MRKQNEIVTFEVFNHAEYLATESKCKPVQKIQMAFIKGKQWCPVTDGVISDGWYVLQSTNIKNHYKYVQDGKAYMFVEQKYTLPNKIAKEKPIMNEVQITKPDGTKAAGVMATTIDKDKLSHKVFRNVCFTGHRPKDLYGYNDKKKYEPLFEEIKRVLTKLDNVCVITGGAQGVDMLAANAAIKLNLPRKLYIPCLEQDRKWDDCGLFGKPWYKFIVENHKYKKVMFDGTYMEDPKCVVRRNHAMVDDSEIVIAVYNRPLSDATSHFGSGTAECIRYAITQRKTIIHINPKTGKTIIKKPEELIDLPPWKMDGTTKTIKEVN